MGRSAGAPAVKSLRQFNGHAAQLARAFFQDRWTRIFFAILFAYVAVALASLFNVLPDPFARLGESNQAPNTTFFMGTDYLGRSVWRKVLYGAKIAMVVGFFASIIAIPIGTVLGLLAGYFGRWVDDVVLWLYATFDAIPQILLLLAVSFVLGPGLSSICIAVGLSSWVGVCRMIRAEVMKVKQKEYVLVAQAMKATPTHIIRRHILPNVFHLVIIDFSLRFIYAVKSEAILSYLGLGLQGKPSWGVMIADAKGELLQGHWWQLTAATAAMFFLVLAINILGDRLRDVLDPNYEGK